MDHSHGDDTPTLNLSPELLGSHPFIGAGRYQHFEVLGAGGAGVVYKAHDTLLDKVVAIKRLHKSATPAQSTRFQREAQILGSMNHPNIMKAVDFGLTEKGEPYLVLDYVHGTTLAQLLKKDGSMSVPDALKLFVSISLGLASAHGKGIIHRDIKPSNVMLVESSTNGVSSLTPQIVDFGLAKAASSAAQELTGAGVGIGTPAYMAPEQIRGLEIDQRTDIYSFGCLMFEVLTGTPPFQGDSVMEVLAMHLEEEADPVSMRAHEVGIIFDPELPADLEVLIARCLEKDPEDRFQAVEQLLKAFPKIETVHPVPKVVPTPAEEIVPPSAKARRAIRIKVGLAALLLSALVFVVVSPLMHSQVVPPRMSFNDDRDVVAFLGAKGDHPNGSKIKKSYALESASPKDIKQGVNNELSAIKGFNSEKPISAFVLDENPTAKRKEHRREQCFKARETSSDRDLWYLIEHEPEIIELRIVNSRVTSAGISQLRFRDDVKTITVSTKGNAETVVKALGLLKSLDKIELHSLLNATARENLPSLKELEGLPKVRRLTFEDYRIGKGSLQSLPKMERLEHMTFQDCTGLNGGVLRELKGCKKLQYICFNHTDIRGESLEDVRDLGLTSIKLKSSKNTPVLAISGLGTIPTLRELILVKTCTESQYQALTKVIDAKRRKLNLPALVYEFEELE